MDTTRPPPRLLSLHVQMHRRERKAKETEIIIHLCSSFVVMVVANREKKEIDALFSGGFHVGIERKTMHFPVQVFLLKAEFVSRLACTDISGALWGIGGCFLPQCFTLLTPLDWREWKAWWIVFLPAIQFPFFLEWTGVNETRYHNTQKERNITQLTYVFIRLSHSSLFVNVNNCGCPLESGLDHHNTTFNNWRWIFFLLIWKKLVIFPINSGGKK